MGGMVTSNYVLMYSEGAGKRREGPLYVWERGETWWIRSVGEEGCANKAL